MPASLLTAAEQPRSASDNGNNTWISINTGLGEGMVNALLVDKTGRLFAGLSNGKVFASDNGGTSWIAINDGLGRGQVITLIKNKAGSVYLQTDNGVFRFSTASQGWEPVVAGLGTRRVRLLAALSDNQVYIGTDDGVLRLNPAGERWDAINAGMENQSISDLQADGSGNLYARSSGSVFRLTPGASSWRSASTPAENTGFLGSSLMKMFVSSNGTIYLGRYIEGYGGGPYRSTDGGQTWELIKTGLPNRAAQNLYLRGAQADGSIYAFDPTLGSLSSGAFRLDPGANAWREVPTPICFGDSYAITEDDNVYRCDANTNASYLIEGPLQRSKHLSTIVPGNSGELYAILADGSVYRLDAAAMEWTAGLVSQGPFWERTLTLSHTQRSKDLDQPGCV
ncbi:hypothetical protein, partial [Chitinimonas sp.]|uniref:hypothetical protein n=1 Tax=Chitinimonas sp. TaxID=1934313 RepID=UPI0035ADB601